MTTRRVLLLFGTRPEAVKMCPLVHAIEDHPGLAAQVVVTGQHRGMLDQMLDLFGVTPDADLNIHAPGQTLTDITTRILSTLPETLQRFEPDVVVVQGDTTTAFAAALAATYARLPVVHVEAGLRSGNRAEPFPEEVNRRLITQMTSLHLAATEQNRNALLTENVAKQDVVVTGNTVIDALLEVTKRNVPIASAELSALSDTDSDQRIVLVTAHRRESWGQPLVDIAGAIARAATVHPDTDFVWPLHANPQVRQCIMPAIEDCPNVITTEALNYADFTAVLARAHVAVTDSGGVQEEAPALGVPVLITREVTERAEVIDAGGALLVGTNPDRIYQELNTLLTDPVAHERMRIGRSPYGDGHAAERAAAAIACLLGVGDRVPDYRG